MKSGPSQDHVLRASRGVWYLLHLAAVEIERGSMAHGRPACVVEGDQRTLSKLEPHFHGKKSLSSEHLCHWLRPDFAPIF
jgi:hypothetical protein